MLVDERRLGPSDGNRHWIVSTEPSTEPITLEEVKVFARIDGDTENSLIEGFIISTRQAIEQYLGRALIEQTITMILDVWPGNVVELPQPPLISITSVSLVEEDNSEIPYENSNYFVVTESIPGQLVIRNGSSLPNNTDRYTAGYKIIFKAGYGSLASNVPYQIREAMKLWTTAVYENRALTPEPPPEARTLLDLYRVIKY